MSNDKLPLKFTPTLVPLRGSQKSKFKTLYSIEVAHNTLLNFKKVISPPLDDPSIIAETTQSRKLLRIIFNKFNEVKPLSAIVC